MVVCWEWDPGGMYEPWVFHFEKGPGCWSGYMVYLARGNCVAGCYLARGWVRCGVLCGVR